MTLKTSVSTLVLLAWAGTACAGNAPEPDSLLAELSRCDGHFFASLHRRASELSGNPYLAKGTGFAYFKVVDRTVPEQSVRHFNAPLPTERLDVVGYFDAHMSLSADDAFLAWGFLLRAPAQEVAKATQHLIWDKERLLQDGQLYTRTELWDPAQPANGWQKVATPGGTESPPDSVERVLRIEADEKDPSLTRFGCVLQGTVTPEMLKSLRPDISGGKTSGAK
ncbi:hypothetical protein [Aquabacterium sp. NJ1]|uniref:hypothetical protein n=1 Tax=Aquabacterium sp. NJ1 TaxID=1538295 RepID=UPI00126A2546|nr:hypothetical protein [Aquabacterium sp. NJ1]